MSEKTTSAVENSTANPEEIPGRPSSATVSFRDAETLLFLGPQQTIEPYDGPDGRLYTDLTYEFNWRGTRDFGTGAFGDMRLIGERYRPDLALVPIGGNFTMDPADAAWAVKDLLKPRAVIPMHYGANPLAKGTAKEFVAAMGSGPVKVVVAVPGQPIGF